MDNPYATPQDSGQPAGSTPAFSGEQRPVNRSISVMDAFRFVSKDENMWANVLYATLLAVIIPIVGPIVYMGWQAEMMQRLVRQHPKPLPKFSFDDFGDYLPRGIVQFVVQLVMILAIVIPMVIGMAALGVFAQSGRNPGEFSPVMLFPILLYPLIFIMMVMIQAGVTRAELTEDWGQAFNIGALFSYAAKTWWPVLWTNFLLGLLMIPLVFVGMLACFIGIYLVVAAIQMMQLHLRWQIYNDFVLKGNEPIKAKELSQLASEKKALAA